MPTKIVGIPFIATGAAINFNLGFIPDEVHLYNKFEETNPLEDVWFKDNYDRTGNAPYGTHIAADGARTKNSTAAAGIASYDDSNAAYVRIMDPAGGYGKVICAVSDWSAATSYASGARTVTAAGTVVRPPTHNGRVFELTTAVGAGTSAPTTWDVAIGATVTDGGTNVWTCREEDIVNTGGKGITIGASLLADSDQCMLVAIQWDRSGVYADAAGKDPVTI